MARERLWGKRLVLSIQLLSQSDTGYLILDSGLGSLLEFLISIQDPRRPRLKAKPMAGRQHPVSGIRHPVSLRPTLPIG